MPGVVVHEHKPRRRTIHHRIGGGHGRRGATSRGRAGGGSSGSPELLSGVAGGALSGPGFAGPGDEPLNVLPEVFGQTRLLQEHVRASLQGAELSRLVGEAGDNDHGDVTRSRVFLDALRSSDAIHPWHRQVQDDHVRPRLQRYLNRRFAISHGLNSKSAQREVQTVEFPGVERIVSDQHQSSTARAGRPAT